MTTLDPTVPVLPAADRPPLVVVEDLVKHYPLKGRAPDGGKQRVHSVDNVSLTIASGEVLGLVGESGCGKSTLARAILGLTPVNSGRVMFEGTRRRRDPGQPAQSPAQIDAAGLPGPLRRTRPPDDTRSQPRRPTVPTPTRQPRKNDTNASSKPSPR